MGKDYHDGQRDREDTTTDNLPLDISLSSLNEDDESQRKQTRNERTTTTTTNATNTADNGNTTAAAAVEFAKLCGRLKTTPRTGWVYRNVPHPESVADHSWRVASLCLLLSQDDHHHHHEDCDTKKEPPKSRMDISKCMEMAILHDLAESMIGDIAPADNVTKEEKHALEKEATFQIANMLARATTTTTKGSSNTTSTTEASNRMSSILEEYEQRQSKEAIAVKDLDLLDMIIQADEYETANGGNRHFLQEFFDGTPVSRFKTDIVRAIAEEVHAQRSKRLLNKDFLAEEEDNDGSPSNMESTTSVVGKCQEEEEDDDDSSPLSSKKKHTTKVISEKDEAFALEYVNNQTKSSHLSLADVNHLIRALRANDKSNTNVI